MLFKRGFAKIVTPWAANTLTLISYGKKIEKKLSLGGGQRPPANLLSPNSFDS